MSLNFRLTSFTLTLKLDEVQDEQDVFHEALSCVFRLHWTESDLSKGGCGNAQMVTVDVHRCEWLPPAHDALMADLVAGYCDLICPA